MSPLTLTVSALRQHMIDDMRKLDGKTPIHCIRAVRRLAAFLKQAPDRATAGIFGPSNCTWSTPARQR
jgi:integrase/recombinase XerD